MKSYRPSPDFRTLFESSPGLYLVLTPDLTIVAVSDAYLRATMTKREDIVGLGLFEVFPDNPADPLATGVGNLAASLDRVRRTRTLDAMAVQKYDIRRPELEGGGFEERYWSPVNYPVLDYKGEVLYIIHRVQDVTEFVRLKQLGSEEHKLTLRLQSRGELMEAEIFQRAQELQNANSQLRVANEALARRDDERERVEIELRKAQNELELRVQERTAELEAAIDASRASEERYRLLFESNPHPMWVYDIETLAFLAVNHSAVAHYGYSQEEFLGMTILDIRPVVEVPAVLEAVRNLSPHGTATVTRRHQKKDGSVIDIEGTSRELIIGGRRARLVLATDVTERKKLEDQLRQAQRMEAVGRLAGGVAHDFNNLLTAIIGYSDLLLDEVGADHEVRRELEEIKDAGKRAAVLTSQLLAFSRKQVLQPRVLDLNESVMSIKRLLRRLIGEDIDMVAVAGSDLGRISADPGQIEQILMNLAVNARDAMPNGGKLTIETANVDLDEAYAHTHAEVTPGRYILLAVSDTGHGMDPETQSHIFEPFFTTKEQSKGTGLGLSTVYGIVKQSGGHIWVYSEPGHGVVFKLYFPRVDEVAESARAQTEIAKPLNGSETILLVEDDQAVRNLVQLALEKYGYTVLAADRGPQALEAFGPLAAAIDLVITDVIMPEMSGRVLVAKLQELHPEVKVLYVSGYTEEATIHHGVLHHGVAFLQKPFTPKALAHKVREVLESAHLVRPDF